MSQDDSRPWYNFEVVFGQRLKKLRRQAGLSQAALAVRMQANGSYFDAASVSRAESGKSKAPISVRDVYAAAKSLGVHEVELLLADDSAALLAAYASGGVPGVLRWATEQVSRASGAPRQDPT
jgi:transcriptional regulator with XRE-family HTH domain